ncbi:hypothetical protein GCM10029963_76980 [Micromonospora andamanensis]|nr:hypothetical protein Vwe01_62630 [Micromonospora andamanensis]
MSGMTGDSTLGIGVDGAVGSSAAGSAVEVGGTEVPVLDSPSHSPSTTSTRTPQPTGSPSVTPSPAPRSTSPDPEPPQSTAGRPNSSNTGYRAGVDLRAWTGPTYDSSSNRVIDGFRLAGSYTFTGKNVTLRNCEITGGVTLALASGVTIDSCTIRGGVAISSSQKVTIRHTNIHDFGADGIHITSDRDGIRVADVTIANSYLHSPSPACDAHADGMQVRGVDRLTLLNNHINMGAWRQVCGKDALNAAVFLQDANGGNQSVTLRDNLLVGGGFTFYLGAGTRTKLIDNVIKRGRYGWVNSTSDAGDVIQATNNVNENGVCLKASDDRGIGLNGCTR